jgi:hypothetical protein
MSFFSLKDQNSSSRGYLHVISFVHNLFNIVYVIFCSYFNSLYLHIVHWVEVIKIGHNLHIVKLVFLHVVTIEKWLKNLQNYM